MALNLDHILCPMVYDVGTHVKTNAVEPQTSKSKA